MTILFKALVYGMVALFGVVYWLAPIHVALMLIIGVFALLLIAALAASEIPWLGKFLEHAYPSLENEVPKTAAQKEFEAAFPNKSPVNVKDDGQAIK